MPGRNPCGFVSERAAAWATAMNPMTTRSTKSTAVMATTTYDAILSALRAPGRTKGDVLA